MFEVQTKLVVENKDIFNKEGENVRCWLHDLITFCNFLKLIAWLKQRLYYFKRHLIDIVFIVH